jgi:cell division septum initiation protein DivIVA
MCKSIGDMATENEALKQRIKQLEDRIKRLEEAGDKAILNSYLPDRLAVWNKAKEAKP